MPTKIIKLENGIKIMRGQGYRNASYLNYSGFTQSTLKDKGATIEFSESKSGDDFSLEIEFSYRSLSGKDYCRSIKIDIKQTIELVKYLNECISKQAIRQNFMLVFVYGANLFESRLEQDLTSAKKVSAAELPFYKLSFTKNEKGILRANMISTYKYSDKVWGVIYEIRKDEKQKLDKLEGDGFDLIKVKVDDFEDKVFTYISSGQDELEESILPYDWYKEYLVKGAEENEFPEEYLNELRGLDTAQDPDEERSAKKWEKLNATE